MSYIDIKPLTGRLILLTGTAHMIKQLKQELTPLGSEIAAVNLLKTSSIMSGDTVRIISQLKNYTWILFTSSNGIDEFFSLLKQYQVDQKSLAQIKFAAIGSACAKRLMSYGVRADFIPPQYTSQSLAESWLPKLSHDDRILILRAASGSAAVTSALAQANISFLDVPLYQTMIDKTQTQALNEYAAAADYITVCSSSCAAALRQMLSAPELFKRKIISIGPATTKTLKSLGFANIKTADPHTAAGIVSLILADQTVFPK